MSKIKHCSILLTVCLSTLLLLLTGCPPKISNRASILMRIANHNAKTRPRLTLKFKNGSYIKTRHNGKILIKLGRGKFLLLHSSRDFSRLLSGATRYAGFSSYADIDALKAGQGAAELIKRNVNTYYAKYKKEYYKSYTPYGGNPLASNKWGSGQFRYQRIVQIHSVIRLQKKVPLRYMTSNRGKLIPKGLECNAAAIFQIVKSLGLIPPELNNFQICERYTDLYSYGMVVRDPKNDKIINNNRVGSDPYRIKSSMGLDQAMRGFYASAHKLNSYSALKIIQQLSQTDWAKLCGSSNKKFRLIFGTTNIIKQLHKGYTAGSMKEWYEKKYKMWMRHHITATAMGTDCKKLSNPSQSNNCNWVTYDDPWHDLTDGPQTRWCKKIFKHFFAIIVH